MSTWESIVVVFGGNVALLAVLGWLARSFGSQLLAKDLEKFKSELSAASGLATEKTKHDLQLSALEHQVRFSKLHERRAEVIAELYGLLVEAQWASQSFASLMEFSGEPSKQEKYVTAMNSAAEFYRYFDKNRIYLPPSVCVTLENFFRAMRAQVIEFGVYVTTDDADAAHVVKEKHEAWIKAFKYFDNEAPEARSVLESELRNILGSEHQNTA